MRVGSKTRNQEIYEGGIQVGRKADRNYNMQAFRQAGRQTGEQARSKTGRQERW